MKGNVNKNSRIGTEIGKMESLTDHMIFKAKLKFIYSETTTTFENKSQFYLILLCNVQKIGRFFFQLFVFFSEYMNLANLDFGDEKEERKKTSPFKANNIFV